MKALILAGGLGSRLGDLTENYAKSMVPVNGKPFLESLILYLRKFGIKEFIFAVGYHADKIIEYFGDGSKWDVNIEYSVEENPLGTAGGIKLAENLIDDDVLVCNGDSFAGVDILELIREHKGNNNDFTMVLIESPQAEDNEVISTDEFGKIIKVFKRETQENKDYRLKNKPYINAGLYVLNKKVFSLIPGGKISLEHEMFPLFIEKINFFGKKFDNVPFIDIGTPERYEKSHEILRRSLE